MVRSKTAAKKTSVSKHSRNKNTRKANTQVQGETNIQPDVSKITGIERSSSSVIISIINNELHTTSSSFPKQTIFKVHRLLRRENEMAYEPDIVSIGPYHRGKDRLQVMEDRKLRWFKSSLEPHKKEKDAAEYVEAMKKLEPRARQCYSESTQNIKEDEFVKMLLLDACFIIQFIRWFLDPNDNVVDSFFQDWILNSTLRDMLLFENQIPLFVLQELYHVMIKLPEEPTHFYELALKFLSSFSENEFRIPKGTMENKLRNPDNINDMEHILGLLHYLLRSVAVNGDSAHHPPTKTKWTLQLQGTVGKFISSKLCRPGRFDQKVKNNNSDGLKSEFIPSAAKLQAAGVQFRKKKDESNPFGINFKNGVMEIPAFTIEDGTESLYRNLIAYEQYNQDASNRCVGLYAKLMDCLIDSADDVAVLHSVGIVGSFLGDDEAISSMFNKLVNEVCVGNVHSKERATTIFEEVNAYYGKRRHKWMATLMSDYFNSPWAWISFLAAVFLLLLTLTQTVFSILGGV